MGLLTELCCWDCRFGVVRKHAKVIAEDVKIARVFREHCVNAWDDDRNAWRSCFSDEHYFATVLATQGLDEVSPPQILLLRYQGGPKHQQAPCSGHGHRHCCAMLLAMHSVKEAGTLTFLHHPPKEHPPGLCPDRAQVSSSRMISDARSRV